ncbi:MAG: ATP-binding protein [Actinobacteria bacterium]|nr:ATP-binding protein [Actinomycetota bacterium]
MVLPAQRPRASTAVPVLGTPADPSADPQGDWAEQLLTGHFSARPTPRAWGWATPGGGRSANVEGGVVYQATSAQVCGLYPFALSSGAATPGVPIGRHMLTAEPVGLDPAEWLREGLVSNTGVWVQGQPGIGKSTIVKRMLTGLICFGAAAVIPGDVKGEYSDLVDALGGGSGASAAAVTPSTRSTPAPCVPRPREPAGQTATGCWRPSAPGSCRCWRRWW